MLEKHPNYGLQSEPKRRWKRLKALKEKAGGFNGGIHEVEDRDAPGRIYIEKVGCEETTKNGPIDQEIVILKHLSNPLHLHITEMVDHYVDRRSGKASIFLEYCTEKDVDMVYSAFDAITYCHFGPNQEAHLNIVNGQQYKTDGNVLWHRDIKPANILVTKGTRPVQDVDFGCAVARKHVWHDRKNKCLKITFHTPGWQPPEAPKYVTRSDVWQLGAVIGSLCTLTHDASRLDVRNPAPGYSKVLNEAIAACMNPNVETRPSASEVLHLRTSSGIFVPLYGPHRIIWIHHGLAKRLEEYQAMSPEVYRTMKGCLDNFRGDSVVECQASMENSGQQYDDRQGIAGNGQQLG
ncbi:kinase-like protein [Lentithecium fluviatile CBS 122367]|uniref:non-specific serine/threonine protein kinase n=1 Tax=Lentithecium fluviatile CBS 122367 TaxID=1168545 RepID=A0A6G1JF87_9PLEO|nr:kinase-like protein [Lentithecium fluviatile CBS 122367]